MQYDKTHATTVVAQGEVKPHRFISYAGTHATSGQIQTEDVLGVSETAAQPGEAFSVVTGFSYPIETAEVLPFGCYVKPADDGSGRAAYATAQEAYGIVLTGSTQAGGLAEVQLFRRAYA